MATFPYPEARWRESSHSDSGADCVEVTRARGRAGIRDSTHPGPVLVTAPASWMALLGAVRVRGS